MHAERLCLRSTPRSRVWHWHLYYALVAEKCTIRAARSINAQIEPALKGSRNNSAAMSNVANSCAQIERWRRRQRQVSRRSVSRLGPARAAVELRAGRLCVSLYPFDCSFAQHNGAASVASALFEASARNECGLAAGYHCVKQCPANSSMPWRTAHALPTHRLTPQSFAFSLCLHTSPTSHRNMAPFLDTSKPEGRPERIERPGACACLSAMHKLTFFTITNSDVGV